MLRHLKVAAVTCGTVLLFLTCASQLKSQTQSAQDYVGDAECARCHAGVHREWAASTHNRIFQRATSQTILGDFSHPEVALRAFTYLLQRRNSSYYITESDLTGKPWQHRIDYALGTRRLQHYLTTLDDGRIVILPPTWDIVRKKWVHNLDTQDPDEPPGDPTPVWNKSCYGCHVTQEQKNFDLQRLAYHTTWKDFGVDCEACHGPGKTHVAAVSSSATDSANSAARLSRDSHIMNPAKLDPLRSTMVCAQCHSFRDIYVDGFTPGANYYDHFLPVMEYRLPASEDPAYWPDGRPRWFGNEALALWQSACFLKGGVTCITCHTNGHNVDAVRTPQTRARTDAICVKCHANIARNASAHTHHAPASSGSSCIECHMPRTVISIKARIRDHSLSIPAPENTVSHAIPNACNVCHTDKNADWAVRQMTEWYGNKSRQKLIQRADAFTQARAANRAAIPLLLSILADDSQGQWIRANAAGYLGSFPDDPSAYNAVRHALTDPEPLVRSTAALSIRPRAAQREELAPVMVSLLAAPPNTVRMSAVIALAAMGVHRPPGQDGQNFDRAVDLYRQRAALNADDAQQQFAAGKFFFLAGDMDSALAAFRATLKLDNTIPAQYYLARVLVEKGDIQSARQILQEIPQNDPQYGPAQRLLAEMERTAASAPPQPAPATQATETQARTAFLDGQLAYQNGRYAVALKSLDEALQLAPGAPWAMKAKVYRAACLEKVGNTADAEAAMQALSNEPGAATDADLQLAYVELLFDTGRPEDALKRVDAFIAAVPDSPMAYFWRAKVFLELHRTAEAAAAAEQSVKLLPDLVPAHNLLLRIYQMQRRPKEAAQQAEWLRDYERRMQSR